MKFLKQAALAGIALALAGSVAAQSKPEDQIRYRQSGYAFLAWNMGKIKAQVIDNPSAFDKAQVVAAANAISAIANSGMGALYGPGTDKGKGWKETQVKAEFFQQPEEVKKVAVAFIQESNKLAEVAAGGDVAAIRAQFGKVGESCKGCHDKFRNKD